jgi:hypothetical protein
MVLGTVQKAMVLSLGLVGLYLVLTHGTDFSNVVKATTGGWTSTLSTLQGR